jgi:hypothetical protein
LTVGGFLSNGLIPYVNILNTIPFLLQDIEDGVDGLTRGVRKGVPEVGFLANALGRVVENASDGSEGVDDLTSSLILEQVAALIIKGDNAAADAMYAVYVQAKDAEDKIRAVMDGLLALNGTSATTYINMVTSSGAPGGGGAIPLPSGPDTTWQPWNDPPWHERKWYQNRWIYRAEGGEVGSGGDSYIVGERGPEVFSPRTPGHVTSNSDLGALSTSIDRMVNTLPTILIDAIERSK